MKEFLTITFLSMGWVVAAILWRRLQIQEAFMKASLATQEKVKKRVTKKRTCPKCGHDITLDWENL